MSHIDLTVIPPINEQDWLRADRAWHMTFRRVPHEGEPVVACSVCQCPCIGTRESARYAASTSTRFVCPACARMLQLETPNYLHIHRRLPKEK